MEQMYVLLFDFKQKTKVMVQSTLWEDCEGLQTSFGQDLKEHRYVMTLNILREKENKDKVYVCYD